MTSELRPAVDVWVQAEVAYEAAWEHNNDKGERAAAAVIEADREAVRAYWYRQGKDDGWQMCKENEIDRLREELAEAYIKLSGKSIHASDCATSNAPAMEPGPCNCDAPGDADLVSKLRDVDSYYRIQEKHWCIDGEELERQRLAAADLIETQAREIERLTQDHRFFAASVLDFYRVCNANRVHDEVLITGEVTAAFNRLYGHIANLARVARNLDLRETDNTCSGVSGQIFKGGKWVWP